MPICKRPIKSDSKKLHSLDIYKLDWIQILNKAIKNRTTSWYGHQTLERDDFIPPVREWQNASDEIAGEVIAAMREAGLLLENYETK